MCQIIIVNRGQKEIETPRQFKQHFGFLPNLRDKCKTQEMDMCLCSFDLDDIFRAKGIEYALLRGDYYVGDLLDDFEYDFRFKPPISC